MTKRINKSYWIAFSIVLALLDVVRAAGVAKFWRRFLTEILIWGLLAMSSDILIGLRVWCRSVTRPFWPRHGRPG